MPARASTSANADQKTDSTMKPKNVSASRRPTSEADAEVQAARTQAPTAVQPIEPEDAYLTGVSRSLQRRLLGLNVEGTRGQSKPVPGATTAAIHSTGSYTETRGAKSGAATQPHNDGTKK